MRTRRYGRRADLDPIFAEVDSEGHEQRDVIADETEFAYTFDVPIRDSLPSPPIKSHERHD